MVKKSLKITIFLSFFICWILLGQVIKNHSSTWDHSWIFHKTPLRSTIKRSQLPPHHKKLLLTIYHIISTWARMNQQPWVHQLRMKPFKPFWGWTKNTSSSPAQGFFSPLHCFKIFPSYLPPPFLPPSYFPHLISHSFHFQSLGELLSLSSTKLQKDVRHNACRRWRAQRWRNMERRRQEECFIPNVEAKEER